MTIETKDKRPTAANLKAFWDGKFSNKDWLKKLRGKMGLGETLGPLPEENGGTASSSLYDKIYHIYRALPQFSVGPLVGYTYNGSYSKHGYVYIRKNATSVTMSVSAKYSSGSTFYFNIASGSALADGTVISTLTVEMEFPESFSAVDLKGWRCIDRADGGMTVVAAVAASKSSTTKTTVAAKALTVYVTKDGSFTYSLSDLNGATNDQLEASSTSSYVANGPIWRRDGSWLFVSPYVKGQTTTVSEDGAFTFHETFGYLGKTFAASDSNHAVFAASNNSVLKYIDLATLEATDVDIGVSYHSYSFNFKIGDVSRFAVHNSAPDISLYEADVSAGSSSATSPSYVETYTPGSWPSNAIWLDDAIFLSNIVLDLGEKVLTMQRGSSVPVGGEFSMSFPDYVAWVSSSKTYCLNV